MASEIRKTRLQSRTQKPIGFDPIAGRLATNIDRTGHKRTVPMEILVLGLSRTGTSSLRQALIDLGYHDVYHFTSVVTENPPDADLWVQALEWKLEGKGTWTTSDWDALLGHCMAVSDHPCLTFTDELLSTYPNAKVILTVRDNVDTWHESVMNTIWPFVELLIWKDVSIWRRLWRIFLPEDRFARMTELFHLNPEGMYHRFPEQGKVFYERHNEKIRRVVDGERLLEFNVKEGWGPLCEFLGKEEPEWEFPRVNERSVFVAHQGKFVQGLNTVVAMNVAKLVVGCAGVGIGAYYFLRRR